MTNRPPTLRQFANYGWRQLKRYPTHGSKGDVEDWLDKVFWSITDEQVMALALMDWKIVPAGDRLPDSKWPFDGGNPYGFAVPDWCFDVSKVTLDTVIHAPPKPKPTLTVVDGDRGDDS